MAIKLLQNVLHDGIFFQAGQILEGVADEVCEQIVDRGLAEKTNEAPTHTFTKTGVDVSPVAVKDNTDATSSDKTSTANPEAVPAFVVEPAAPANVVSPEPAAPVAVSPALVTAPTAEDIAKTLEGIQ